MIHAGDTGYCLTCEDRLFNGPEVIA